MTRVTLQNIADHLNLSRSTVCRGLQNHPNTSKETRRRIRQACEELGYRPDPVLSELAVSHWKPTTPTQGRSIAYIISSPGQGVGVDLSANLHEEASVLGYKLEVFYRREFRDSAKLQSVLRNRGITDLILGTFYEESMTVDLDWKNFVAIQLFPGLISHPLHSVVRDHFNCVLLAWQKAVERGYQRIGIVLIKHLFPVMDDTLRQSGALACQNFIFPHLPAIPPLVQHLPAPENIKEFVGWVKSYQPDVIIGFSAAYHSYYCSEFGHDIPFVCLHNSPATSLSGIHDSPDIYAKEAINLLNFCRKSHQWGIPAHRIYHAIEPTWLEGGSLPIKSPKA